MSDILRRTIFIDDSSGVVRFHDWAVVTTELGSMMEPHPEIRKTSFDTVGGAQDFDALEPMSRIDRIERISLDRGLQIFGDTVSGGRLIPAEGR